MKRVTFIALFIIIALFGKSAITFAQTSADDLRNSINEKVRELEELNARIQETQQTLNLVAGQKRTLSTEIRRFDQTINQLSLNIRASEVNIDKLGLELEKLGIEIEDIERGIDSRKASIASSLRLMQLRDKDGLVETVFKYDSLADGLAEVQALNDLRNTLSLDVAFLDSLHSDLTEAAQLTQAKKSEVELERMNLSKRKSIVDDQRDDKAVLLKQTQNKESVYQAQLAELEGEQRKIAEEIDRIESELRAKFDKALLPTPAPGVLSYPIKDVRITQGYGPASVETRRFYSNHNGIDFGVPTGTPIFAVSDGLVIAMDNNDIGAWKNYQYGRYVLIQHDNNLSSLYAHLSGYAEGVGVGSRVKRGQVIGYSGGGRGAYGSGVSLGPHLHFTVYYCGTTGWLKGTSLDVLQNSNLCGLVANFKNAAGSVPIGAHIDPSPYL
ncbi:MAG: peptidoglycan DD-metalloendopeptidase family protein [Candidatus Colwellbacteria bacterium]|nr:peptidoglycan DD-metalloendopeptidase family protein [Candidatus Colwellbacteria bacterium]